MQLCSSSLTWVIKTSTKSFGIDYYYITFTEDSRMLKAIIYAVYLIETIFTAMIAYDLTQLVVDPNYTACFASIIISICGGLGALRYTSNLRT